ncbi:hypothetical protein [Ethanoligenens harbinense]|uniref:Uncharacterized protein n=1 Tax=Ethanoligenens harbinense (strain DSM 18485 / JCM 12961 / CGMCC 1.5033 / YUAN-3) TaxID=663278 RepID=E6U558_ETHHY|nr:hypothetical protein [Ethanoligenens harbinense]ADU27871.1 hypothetical protein Ethha_2370 [Ethanoligenens harbinense YUAN-3]AVQ96898.1 hypothetical protein CXQ68_12185 [Ethanoligenens harbinense YUAN-3]AYF39559.1 hypothetical protein CXP51_12080 [Ethanoligenens harbinense]AYF42385.1 hypothetical protein CN246_12630 [Ethanoligenens harbinense]QCN93138.1 hypothetical protein DRA42_12220 [Ethanoligenens harbinense]
MKKVKALLSLILSAILVFTMAVTPVHASSVAKAETASSIRLVSMNSTTKNCISIALDTAAMASGIPGLPAIVAPLMNLISPSPDAQILQDVTEIKNELTKMENQLNTIDSKLSSLQQEVNIDTTKASLGNALNSFYAQFQNYPVIAQDYLQQIDSIQSMPTDTADEKAQQQAAITQFFQSIYYSTPVNGSQDIFQSVQNLRQLMTKTWYTNANANYDIIGTFDEYECYAYPWEHQAYTERQSFRAYVIGTYSMLNAIALMSLEYANQNPPSTWANHPGTTYAPNYYDGSGFSPQIELTNFESNLQDVNTILAGESTFTRRPSDQRYYQVPGHECLLASSAENWPKVLSNSDTGAGCTSVFTGQIWTQTCDALTAGQFSNNNLGIANTRPTSDWLEAVYKDYGGTSLYDIFLQPDNGNFTADSGISGGMVFLTNTSNATGNDVSAGGDGKWWDNATIVDDSGQLDSNYTIAWGMATDGGNWEVGIEPDVDSWYNTAHCIGLAVLNQTATPMGYDVATIACPSATNGSVSVDMQYPTTTELDDFTATYSIDGGDPQPLALTGISGSGSNYTLSFDQISAAAASHSIAITVNYCGNTASAPAFTVSPAVAAVNGTNYSTFQDALNAAATSGDTVTLLNNVTESDTVTTTSGQTITIDGENYTLTAPDNSSGNSNALTVTGGGTLILKNITLQGGAANGASGNSIGLDADSGFSGTVIALGTVNANGGDTSNSGNGVENDGSGTVNVSTANSGEWNGSGTYDGSSGVINGAYNGSSGVINVGTAKGAGSGVYNSSSGVINVGTATGNCNNGVYNGTSGTVNANTVISCGLEDVANGWAVGGTINVGGQVTGDNAGTINYGSNVKTVTLHAGDSSSCVLGTITIAANESTNVGALPAVCDVNGNVGEWFTDPSLTTKASPPLSSSTTDLYSTFYTAAKSDPLTADCFVVTNNSGSDDTVTIKNLNAGDIVKMYDAPTAGNMIGTASADNAAKATASTTSTTGENLQVNAMTAAAGKLHLATDIDITPAQKSVTLHLKLASSGGSIYVTRTSTGKTESTRIQITYAAESAESSSDAGTASSASSTPSTTSETSSNQESCSSTVSGTGSSHGSGSSSARIQNPHTGSNDLASNLPCASGTLILACVSVLLIRKKSYDKD